LVAASQKTTFGTLKMENDFFNAKKMKTLYDKIVGHSKVCLCAQYGHIPQTMPLLRPCPSSIGLKAINLLTLEEDF
jgi:hypothetical protein